MKTNVFIQDLHKKGYSENGRLLKYTLIITFLNLIVVLFGFSPFLLFFDFCKPWTLYLIILFFIGLVAGVFSAYFQYRKMPLSRYTGKPLRACYHNGSYYYICDDSKMFCVKEYLINNVDVERM